MSGRGVRRTRSTLEWGVRVFFAVVALTAGYIGLSHTLGYALRYADPAQAYRIASHDGRITALLARTLSGPAATIEDRVRGDRLAHTALHQDPTVVVAATVLGLNAGTRGDTVTARHFLTYAETLSRRELAPQLWAIEDAVARKDIPLALRHYDIALRTSKQAPDLLFPVLVTANADSAVRVELARTLAKKPAWGNGFVDYLSMSGSDPATVADLLRRLVYVGFPVSQGARTTVLKKLLAQGRIDEAWSYYSSLRSGVDRRHSRDARFVQKDTPTPFDWNLREDGVHASIQRGATGGTVDFSAPSGVGGIVLEQTQLLPEGTYRLEGHSLGVLQDEGGTPYWSLRCHAGNELNRIDVPASSQAGGVFSGTFKVPAGCPIQMLELTVRPSEAITGATGQIDRVRIYPVYQK